MSSQIFDQVIGIDFGSFGSAAVACEHSKPGVIPRVDLIRHTGGYPQMAQYAKSKNLSALLLDRKTKKLDCWGYKAEEKFFQTKVLLKLNTWTILKANNEKQKKKEWLYFSFLCLICKHRQKIGANMHTLRTLSQYC
ncbi:hypothetical protein RFI_07580 [Reticulomyxa filosa]|uniref:Uncharacterized protein n=1 Tax=Reticulomyxa filosa TaxID=46433 RepID=X6NU58_RETFI|nr:hypothetical protein RFI_07580 [Reticulomyxa filosa]|eukprot:ETO29541.1 hypothetical protein RFI_07580 [Reticulomyxa filosa]